MAQQYVCEGAADVFFVRELAWRKHLRVEKLDDLRAQRSQLTRARIIGRRVFGHVRSRAQNVLRVLTTSLACTPTRSPRRRVGSCQRQIVGDTLVRNIVRSLLKCQRRKKMGSVIG